jgi:DNA-binding NarL/FixJ family response regulator
MEPDGRPQEDAAIVQLRLNGNMTSRQLEVLALLKEGKANKIIAHQLGMSESTVKAHVRNIMRMMGVRNRTQVACSTQDWGTMQGGGL